MMDGGAPVWRALPPALTPEEVALWCPRIAQPVAVTGGTGFVGSHLVDALRRGGVQLRLMVRDPSRLPETVRPTAEIIRGTLGSRDALTSLVAGCPTVVHVAGLVRAGRPAAFDVVNRVGTENLVRVLAEVAPTARLVHVSSLAAAGPSRDPRGIEPDVPPRPVSSYGRSKLAAEEAVQRYLTKWVILRPPTTYGPRDTDVLQFFRLAALGFVPIPAGERFLTVAHVSDVVRAALAALAGATERCILHIGNPTPDTLRSMLSQLAESGGVRVRTVPVPGAIVRTVGLGGDILQWLGLRGVAMTSDKARELLARHWTARTEDSLKALGLAGVVPIPAGFAATWTWYRQSGWLPRATIRATKKAHPEKG
jgi:nucleoside-diphosphate-sugar epimerase